MRAVGNADGGQCGQCGQVPLEGYPSTGSFGAANDVFQGDAGVPYTPECFTACCLAKLNRKLAQPTILGRGMKGGSANMNGKDDKLGCPLPPISVPVTRGIKPRIFALVSRPRLHWWAARAAIATGVEFTLHHNTFFDLFLSPSFRHPSFPPFSYLPILQTF